MGDLEEAHRRRAGRHGRTMGSLLTSMEAVDVSVALLRERLRGRDRSPSRRARRKGPAVSWLDFKLGVRMLVRYPGLTVVGGLAIAFAIWVGAGTFELMTQVVSPTLPLPEGDRIVGVRLHDVESGRMEGRLLHDFGTWRDEATSLRELGAFRSVQRNLITGDGVGEPVTLAEMTATGFAVPRIPPLLGRVLMPADEVPGAPDVVVIGFELWQSRFSGDPEVVGRTVGLGRTRVTVVGVMPEGFAFPISHVLWAPLRLSAIDYERRAGPSIQVFGRLAPGASMEDARAEMTSLTVRAAAAYPETDQRLRPQVLPYARAALNMSPNAEREIVAALLSSNLFLIGLLAVICCNVALLIFARAAARESELIVRTALGASRARIVAQLFTEALVLGTVGAGVGLAAVALGLRWGLGVLESQFMGSGTGLPFWFRDTLTPSTVVYAVLLTLLGAAIAGILPAFKVTRNIGEQLRQTTSGGGGLRFGGIWTAVIITQVAVTVAFPAIAFMMRQGRQHIETSDVGFETTEYLAVRLEMDRDPPPDTPADTSRAAFMDRYRATYEELERRMREEPLVADVTFAERLPKMYHPWNQIEVDQGAVEPPDARGHRLGVVSVDTDYFRVLGTSILSGREFDSGDVASDARVVIVNESFVENVLGGRNPIGRRVRFVASESSREPDFEGPWHDIVGLVEDMGTVSGYGSSGVYRPAEPGSIYPVHMAMRVRGEPMTLAPRLTAAATAANPTLRLYDIIRMDDTIRDEVKFYEFWFMLTLVVSAVALLLSLTGIYSVMSFTVARRTREIGIRVALGSDSRRIAAAVFRRPLTHVSIGIAIGIAFCAMLTHVTVMADQEVMGFWPRGVLVVGGYAVIMTLVCMLACIVPMRRALRVQPMEALQVEG